MKPEKIEEGVFLVGVRTFLIPEIAWSTFWILESLF